LRNQQKSSAFCDLFLYNTASDNRPQFTNIMIEE